MKLTQKQQIKLNKIKQLFDTSYRNDINTFKFSGTTKIHSEYISKVTHALYFELDQIFYVEPMFKTGYRPDVYVPLYLGGIFIEIRHSETERLSKAKLKRIPKELKDCLIIYVDTDKEFKLEMIQ